MRRAGPQDLQTLLRMQLGACREVRADLRTFIRFELPDQVEDKYGEEVCS